MVAAAADEGTLSPVRAAASAAEGADEAVVELRSTEGADAVVVVVVDAVVAVVELLRSMSSSGVLKPASFPRSARERERRLRRAGCSDRLK